MAQSPNTTYPSTVTPPANQNPPPPTPQTGAPTNKVMLKSQVDSMDSKKRTTPRSPQTVYPDTSRYRIYSDDTLTNPKRR